MAYLITDKKHIEGSDALLYYILKFIRRITNNQAAIELRLNSKFWSMKPFIGSGPYFELNSILQSTKVVFVQLLVTAKSGELDVTLSKRCSLALRYQTRAVGVAQRAKKWACSSIAM